MMNTENECKIEKSNRTITRIVIHCSATLEGVNFKAVDIDRWHKAKGWQGIGYHYVIDLDGKIELGRSVHQQGAHACELYNRDSIGICYIGGLSRDPRGKPADTRTKEQRESLWWLLSRLRDIYPTAKILGHRDLPGVRKACPCFDVIKEFKKL